MMKRYAAMMLLIISAPVIAQEEKEARPLRKNEIRLDIPRLLTGYAVNLSYERYTNALFSFGTTLNIRVAAIEFDGNYDPKDQHCLLLFGRLYPFKTGFYLEGFTGITTSRGKPVKRIINNEGFLVFRRVFKTYTDAVLGGAIGGKISFTKQVIMEFSIGIGGNLFNKNTNDFIIRGGIALGYKF